MDWVMAKSSPVTFNLLAPECRHLLNDAEHRVLDTVERYIASVPASLFDTPVFHYVLWTLEVLGDKSLQARADAVADWQRVPWNRGWEPEISR